ncbi:MAG: ribosome recycling factor [Hyphomicrobiales bacterium]
MAQPAAYNGPELKRRMHGAVEVLKHDFGGLRTGRASATLLEPIHADAYGASMPLNQIASITVPEPRLLQINVWDKGLVIAVEKAIQASNLGLNPQTEGQVIRLRMPDLTQDRRKELVKVAHQYAEKARIAVRNVRRDGMDQLKGLEKEHLIGEDDHKNKAGEVQKMTDETIKEIDAALKAKEAEIMQV